MSRQTKKLAWLKCCFTPGAEEYDTTFSAKVIVQPEGQRTSATLPAALQNIAIGTDDSSRSSAKAPQMSEGRVVSSEPAHVGASRVSVGPNKRPDDASVEESGVSGSGTIKDSSLTSKLGNVIPRDSFPGHSTANSGCEDAIIADGTKVEIPAPRDEDTRQCVSSLTTPTTPRSRASPTSPASPTSSAIPRFFRSNTFGQEELDIDQISPPAGTATRPRPPIDRVPGILALDPDMREMVKTSGKRKITNHRPRPRQQAPQFERWPKLDFLFPTTIKAQCSIRYQGDPDVQRKIAEAEMDDQYPIDDDLTDESKDHAAPIPRFKWYRKAAWNELSPERHMRKLKKGHEDLEYHTLYIRRGLCRIHVTPGLELDLNFDRFTDVHDLAQYAIWTICGFINKHPFEACELDVRWEYSSMRLQPRPDNKEETVLAAISGALNQKKITNMFGQKYIPRCDLKRFEDYPVLFRILEQENDSAESADDSVKDIVDRGATRLLLICVSRDVPLFRFRHLLQDHEFSDDDIEQLLDDDLGDLPPCSGSDPDSCMTTLEKIMDAAPPFFAKLVGNDPGFKELPPSVVLPLHKLSDSKAHQKLAMEDPGKGANGIVEFVWVDPSHHEFPGKCDSIFALKKGHVPGRPSVSLTREITVLEELQRYPHPHIVPPISCWRRHGVDYILLPKARHDLRAMLQHTTAPDLNKNTVSWFFDQLIGLAGAIAHFQDLKGENQSTETSSNVRWGYHHDIKPENILIFERVFNHHPILKISDFGAGHISSPNEQGLSHKISEVIGTASYFAPEAEKGQGGASRPFDMWSLGCVFLELLVWLFRVFDDSDGDEHGFGRLRQSFAGVNSNDVDDKFYWKDPQTNTYQVKPPVVEVINKLKQFRCRDMWVFEKLIDAIYGPKNALLVVEVEKRLTPEKLVHSLENIRKQVDRDIREASGTDIYHIRYQANRLGSDGHISSEKPTRPTIHTGITVLGSDSTRSASPAGDMLDGEIANLESPEAHRPRSNSSLLRSAGEGMKATNDLLENNAEAPQLGPDTEDMVQELDRLDLEDTPSRRGVKDNNAAQ